MTLIRIKSAFFVSRLNCFFQKSGWAFAEKCTDEFVIVPIALLPYLFKAVLVQISDNYSAAKPAEYVAERVDMDAFG